MSTMLEERPCVRHLAPGTENPDEIADALRRMQGVATDIIRDENPCGPPASPFQSSII